MTTIEKIARDIRASAPATLRCNGEGVVAIPIRHLRALDAAIQASPGIPVYCVGCGRLLSRGHEVETRTYCDECEEARK